MFQRHPPTADAHGGPAGFAVRPPGTPASAPTGYGYRNAIRRCHGALSSNASYARDMTESLHIGNPRIMVLGVQPGTPPFRVVEIDGEVVGEALAITDVLVAAAAAGITVHDLDDPDVVCWVGGDKFTWMPSLR